MVPRFSTDELSIDEYKVVKKFPNPTATVAFLDRIFLLQDRINYLNWFTYMFLIAVICIVHDYGMITFLLLGYIFSKYCEDRF